MQTNNAKLISIWLFICCFMVLSMTIIGAITRLTESGLSITDWNVVMGTLPPLNEQAWQVEFDKYKASPEFIQKHNWMELSDYKKIYFWEWLHRLWGRMIGVVFAVPLLILWTRKMIPDGYHAKFLGLLALGGLQGFMGWFMVQSGLVDRPSVSHYRLAAHLSLALIIFSCLLWLAIEFLRKVKPLTYKMPASKGLIAHGVVTMIFVALTIIWGAFVAGLDAGMIYNQFPLMGMRIMPDELLSMTPAWINVFENHASVQFVHRWLAMATALVVLSFAAHGLSFDKKHFALLGVWVIIQVTLGIKTLLSMDVENPMNKGSIHLAATHQLGAVILLSLMIMIFYRMFDSRKQMK
jgi:cytochrome c oxidase assembly protein subunit 15